MATTTQPLPIISSHYKVISPDFLSSGVHSCRRAAKTFSEFWSSRSRNYSKMFQSDTPSFAQLQNIIGNQSDQGIEDDLTTLIETSLESPSSLKDSNSFLSKDHSYASSSCSSGYSSSDSAVLTDESDLNEVIAKVSTTEIGTTRCKLQSKVLSKKRNSQEKDQIYIAGKGFLSNISNTVLTSTVTFDPESVGCCSSPNMTLEIPAAELARKTGKSKRSSSICSTSSENCVEGTPRTRVRDEDGFIRRAACVCVNEDESKVVLISSKNDGGGWLVPGGGLEAGEEDHKAALREAWEEAGITGSIKRCLGVFQLEDGESHKRKRTAVYVLKVLQQHSTFPEAQLGRTREWYPIDTAMEHLSKCKPHQVAYLKALKAHGTLVQV